MTNLSSEKEKKLQTLRRLAKGKTPVEGRRLTMEERLEFLDDFRRYAENICTAIGNHMTPTASSAHQDKNIENWEPVSAMADHLEVASNTVREPGKDGNHHKAGRYFRAIVNHYHAIADEMTKISHDFTPAFANKDLHISSRFDLKTKPNELKEQFEKLLLAEARRTYNRLKDYQPKHD